MQATRRSFMRIGFTASGVLALGVPAVLGQSRGWS
ncbi:Flavocytochrome C OS=Bosea thiooxidans OX=53254 GN=ARD30_15255 PE=4 SV=1 [Bosea thiooxidans]